MDTVVDRLIRYAKVYSESDYHAGRSATPSTDRQFDMAKLLVEELRGLGIENARYDDKCYVYATLEPTPGCEHLPAIGLIAHMDTTPDMTGKDVKPQIIHYTGGDVVLNREQNIVMEAAQFPELQKFVGQELVCTDGTTLLGADDKAGIAIILQAVEELNTRLGEFDEAVAQESVVNMRNKANSAFEAIDALAAIDRPEAMKDLQTNYVDGCNKLKDALNSYIDLYTEISSATEEAPFDFSAYDGRVKEIQDAYNEGIDKLKAAAASEAEEVGIYTDYAKTAREEGFEKLAFLFDGVGKIEKEHEERYLTLLKNLEEGVVFKRGDEYVWKCRNCGHIHFGKTAPEVCPICAHPQAYFQIKAENY